MNLGDIGPGDSVDLMVEGIQVGQVLRLEYTQAPGDEETELALEPSSDVLFRQVNHEREPLENGYIRHLIYFQVERIGV